MAQVHHFLLFLLLTLGTGSAAGSFCPAKDKAPFKISKSHIHAHAEGCIHTHTHTHTLSLSPSLKGSKIHLQCKSHMHAHAEGCIHIHTHTNTPHTPHKHITHTPPTHTHTPWCWLNLSLTHEPLLCVFLLPLLHRCSAKDAYTFALRHTYYTSTC